MTNLDKLPPFCAATHVETGDAILVKRGERGYWDFKGAIAEEYNKRLGVTPQQAAAMVTGSAFGFHIPATDPDSYTEEEARKIAYGGKPDYLSDEDIDRMMADEGL